MSTRSSSSGPLSVTYGSAQVWHAAVAVSHVVGDMAVCVINAPIWGVNGLQSEISFKELIVI